MKNTLRSKEHIEKNLALRKAEVNAGKCLAMK